MKTLTIITLAALTFSTSAFANSNDKFYQVTDNGKFQYSYWTEEDNAKAGVKPVTLRTFFLETSKNGLLPSGMSYNEFVKLSVEEKQNIVTVSQYDIIAAMENTEEIATENATATESMMSVVEEEKVSEEIIEEESTEERVAIELNAAWIVKAITNPGTETDMPTDKVEITVEEDTTLPWVVDLMVNEGRQIEASYSVAAVKTSKSLSASK